MDKKLTEEAVPDADAADSEAEEEADAEAEAEVSVTDAEAEGDDDSEPAAAAASHADVLLLATTAVPTDSCWPVSGSVSRSHEAAAVSRLSP